MSKKTHLLSLSWIGKLLSQLVESSKTHDEKDIVEKYAASELLVIPQLPVDIIINILTRLPADDVVEFRRVCKLWRELTSTPSFAELHLQRLKPSLLVQGSRQEDDGHLKTRLFVLERNGKKKKITMANTESVQSVVGCCPLLLGTCNGLLLFKETCWPSSNFCVINPITKAKITVQPPRESGQVIVIFYEKSTMDYKLLHTYQDSRYDFHYSIYSIRNKNWRHIATLDYKPLKDNHSPIAANGNLHWMAIERASRCDCNKAIMVYNISTEKFNTMAHPGHKCALYKARRHRRMFLMEMKERLSLGKVENQEIEIWVLEDYTNKRWIKRYNINLRQYFAWSSPFRLGVITSLYVENGEVLYGFVKNELFFYHLELKYMKQIYSNEIGMGLPWKEYDLYGHAYSKSFITF